MLHVTPPEAKTTHDENTIGGNVRNHSLTIFRNLNQKSLIMGSSIGLSAGLTVVQNKRNTFAARRVTDEKLNQFFQYVFNVSLIV